MGGLVYWTIRVLVMAAFYGMIVLLIPAINLSPLFDQLPDFAIWLINLFMIPMVLTAVFSVDAAAFMIRRFNP